MKQEIKFTLEVEKDGNLFTFSMPYASTSSGLGTAYEVLHQMIHTIKAELDARHKKLEEMKEKEEKESVKEDTKEDKID